jgi:pimeloyl-ACP methyl ester carboxylesterase
MLADKYPADVKKMVIVDTLPFYAIVFKPDATVETIKPQADVIKQQMIAMPNDQFATMQPMMVGSMVINPDARKLVAASSVASDRAVFANAMYEDLQTDLRTEVGNIKTPMLLLYPYDATVEKDSAKWDAVYKDAYAAKSNLTMVRVDDSRHFIMYDQPEKMDAAMEAFLK